MKQKEGKFVVLEGQGFAGKDEQKKILIGWLRENNVPFTDYREPGGTPRGEIIRAEILKAKAEGASNEYILQKFYEARLIGLEKVVIPRCKAGDLVTGSRFTASSMVYQGIEAGLKAEVERLESQLVRPRKIPDLYILLDVPAEEIVRRMEMVRQNGSRVIHSFNESNLGLMTSRREAYRELFFQQWSGNWCMVDGVGTEAEVFSRVLTELQARKIV